MQGSWNTLETGLWTMHYGRVVSTLGSDLALVSLEDSADPAVECSVLETTDGCRLSLRPDDLVLVSLPRPGTGRGFVVGRTRMAATFEVANPEAETDHEAQEAPTLPDTLILQANRELTLRVGDGSITIRADGKILIKGKDLVSHAQRMNRIKGGSVAIN